MFAEHHLSHFAVSRGTCANLFADYYSGLLFVCLLAPERRFYAWSVLQADGY